VEGPVREGGDPVAYVVSPSLRELRIRMSAPISNISATPPITAPPTPPMNVRTVSIKANAGSRGTFRRI
jgi:hypothetical protein